MQIIWCCGGLGNQMFQYAFYRRLQLDLVRGYRYDKFNDFSSNASI